MRKPWEQKQKPFRGCVVLAYLAWPEDSAAQEIGALRVDHEMDTIRCKVLTGDFMLTWHL